MQLGGLFSAAAARIILESQFRVSSFTFRNSNWVLETRRFDVGVSTGEQKTAKRRCRGAQMKLETRDGNSIS